MVDSKSLAYTQSKKKKKRNEIASFVEMWLDLESVIQNEAKSEREYTWNLDKWYRRTHFQGGNRETDVENGLGRVG